jgi:hypothetical protein
LSPIDSQQHVASRTGAAAFGVGLLLSIVASGGIVGERVVLGRVTVGIVATAVATLAVMVTAGAATRRALLVPQVLGAVTGVVLVHVLLRHGALGTFPWLSEAPPQLVNDAVAVSGLLALTWACAGELEPGMLLAALVVATLYRATAPMWHVDHVPGALQATVQQFVVAQLVAVAFAVGVYRTLAGRRLR